MNLTRKIHCLDEAVCDEIVQALEATEFKPSAILRKGSNPKEDIRTSSSSVLNKYHQDIVHDALNASLTAWSTQIKNEYPEIQACLNLPGVTLNLQTYHETISVLRYKPGQKYDWHTDAPITQCGSQDFDARKRLISCVLYLNHNFVGGETEMLGRKYLPEKGKVLIFPSNWNYPHRACPVTEGTKYAVVTWYHPDD